jgi:hypothetical protein
MKSFSTQPRTCKDCHRTYAIAEHGEYYTHITHDEFYDKLKESFDRGKVCVFNPFVTTLCPECEKKRLESIIRSVIPTTRAGQRMNSLWLWFHYFTPGFVASLTVFVLDRNYLASPKWWLLPLIALIFGSISGLDQMNISSRELRERRLDTYGSILAFILGILILVVFAKGNLDIVPTSYLQSIRILTSVCIAWPLGKISTILLQKVSGF